MPPQEALTLVQLRYSHFNEKVRWALDLKRVPHQRRTLVAGFHKPYLRKLGCRTTPVLLRDGEVWERDSTDIIAVLEEHYPIPPLYPAAPEARERALALEDFCDEEVGPYVRQAMFYVALPYTRFFMDTFAGHLNIYLRTAVGLAVAAGRSNIRRGLNLTPEAYRESRQKLTAGFARLERELDGREYFVDDRFTVADLTVAALLSPMLMAPEHPHRPKQTLPKPIRNFLDEWNEKTTMLDWGRDIYRKHRGAQ
ncbi:MAG: glutathione S-transferase family protein [Acidobacteriota bacterium]|nr:glutathione S-transferase family protein [Acidobacteriota bacterium]